jgi:cytochrome P450
MSSNTIPAPRSLPFIGHIQSMLNLNNNPLPFLTERYARFGRFSAVASYTPNKPSYLLAFGAAYNQAVLSNPAQFHTVGADTLKESPLKRLASGLLSMNGERHRQQRRLMMPSFHKQAVSDYAGMMAQATEDTLKTWPMGGQVDLMSELRRLITRIVGRALFGLDDPVLTDQTAVLMQRWIMMSQSPLNMIIPWKHKHLQAVSGELESALLTMVARKRQGALGTDVLSMLVAAHDEEGGRLTDGELVGQAAILFLAGHETTVNALSWTLILLSRTPDLRLALVEELGGILGGVAPTTEQAYALPLLDKVIKESMRILPPVVYTLRQATSPFEMDGHAFAKDSMVFLSHYITHRLPELYSQPRQFDPARWEHITPSSYEYIPFSAGPRLCIGATFASLEMRVILGLLLQRVQIEPMGAVDYQTTSSILHPKGSLPVSIYPADVRRPAWPLRGTLAELID